MDVTEHLVCGSALSRALADTLQAAGNLSVPSVFDALFRGWLQALQKGLRQVCALGLGERECVVSELLDRCRHVRNVVFSALPIKIAERASEVPKSYFCGCAALSCIFASSSIRRICPLLIPAFAGSAVNAISHSCFADT